MVMLSINACAVGTAAITAFANIVPLNLYPVWIVSAVWMTFVMPPTSLGGAIFAVVQVGRHPVWAWSWAAVGGGTLFAGGCVVVQMYLALLSF